MPVGTARWSLVVEGGGGGWILFLCFSSMFAFSTEI